MTIYGKLQNVQCKLKAPKGQYNSFGKYNYRNCEDILEAVKPLLKEEGLTLNVSDELVLIGERYYVKATALLLELEGTGQMTAMGYAREEENKKGMDGSQVTGASSSYARKYALNGMFLIDDTKDSDSTNTGDTKGKKEIRKPEEPKANPELAKIISEINTTATTLTCDKTLIADAVKLHHSIDGVKNANYNSIKDLSVANAVLAELKKLVK
jgi:hypothetical protein